MVRNTEQPTFADLFKIFVALALLSSALTALAYWIEPVLGVVSGLFLAGAWTFVVAPTLAGQMVAAIIRARRQRKMQGK